jgi:hypothetical protein
MAAGPSAGAVPPAAPISVEDYAFVTAGLLDELELTELIGFRGIDTSQWKEGQDYWAARIRNEVVLRAGVADELSRLRIEARRAWHRPVPPLDEDLRAWLDFQRTVLTRPDPLAELRQRALTLGDLTFLQVVWQGRIAADQELAREAVRILADEPQEVQVPQPPRPRLPQRAWARPRTPRLSLGEYAALTVELATSAEHRGQLLMDWDLDEVSMHALDEHYGFESERDPDVGRALALATVSYLRWREYCR